MWGFLSTVVVCVTILFWSRRYVLPAYKPEQKELGELEDVEQDTKLDFDAIIAEIYGREND